MKGWCPTENFQIVSMAVCGFCMILPAKRDKESNEQTKKGEAEEWGKQM